MAVKKDNTTRVQSLVKVAEDYKKKDNAARVLSLVKVAEDYKNRQENQLRINRQREEELKRRQLEDERRRLEATTPAEVYESSFKGTKTSVTPKTYNNYLAEFKNARETGMFDSGTDWTKWSTEKINSTIDELTNHLNDLEQKRNAAGKIEARKQELEDLWRQEGAYKGLDNLDDVLWSYELGGDLRISKRPDDYNTGNNRENYDKALYDHLHGDGAYAQRVEALNTDADVDALEQEMDDLWTRFENKTLYQIPDQDEELQREKKENKQIILGDPESEGLLKNLQDWKTKNEQVAGYETRANDILTANDTTGQYGKGNIDLNDRQVIDNPDGSISTVSSFSTNIDGKEVLLPTIIDGKRVSEEEAIQHYLKTGEYLGIFDTPEEADQYADMLSKRQDWYYALPDNVQRPAQNVLTDPWTMWKKEYTEYNGLNGASMFYADYKGNDADTLYTWIHSGEEERRNLNRQLTLDEAKAWSKYWLMDPAQVQTFDYYYLSGDKKGAVAYLEALSQYYLDPAKANMEQLIARQEAEGPLGALYGIESIVERPIAGVTGAIGTVLGLLGVESAQNPKSGWYQGQAINDAIRTGRNVAWGENAEALLGSWAKEPAKFLNSVFYSMADMGVAMGLSSIGGAAFGSGFVQPAVQFIMSSEAASSTMTEQLEKNRDPQEAALYAIGSGAIEWITEKYSVEALLKPNVKEMLGNKKQIAKYIAKNFVAEGSEEGAADILNLGLDAALSTLYGHQNEIEDRRDEILAANPNMKPEDALNQAWIEQLEQTGLSMLAGGVSGLGMAGGNVALNTISQRATGKSIQSSSNVSAEGKSGLEQVIELGRGMKEGTESRALAEKLQEKTEKGKEPTNAEVGRLAQLVTLESGEQQGELVKDTIRRNVESQLTKSGVSPKYVRQYAGIITDSMANGGTLTKENQQILAQSEAAINVWKSFHTYSEETRQLIKEVSEATKEARNTIRSIDELSNGAGGTFSVIGDEVAQSVKETKNQSEAIDNLLKRRGELISEDYAKLAKEILETEGKQNDSRFLDDAMKIRLAAMTLAPNAPKTGISTEAAQRLYDQARKEFDEAEKSRIRNYTTAKPGEGVATFNGAEYGTAAWRRATEGLNKNLRNQMGAIGEVAARMGMRVNFINDTEHESIFGQEDNETGAITINIAGRSSKTGLSHHMLVTLSHEMTHWLEQNSKEGYAQLRQYVLDSLRSKGESIEKLVANTIDSHNMILGTEKGLSINGAVAEVVARSCENLLSSKAFANEIAKTNPSLYSKIKTYVKNFMARLRNAVEGMNESLSREAIALLNETEKIAEIWLGARKEAMGRKIEGPTLTLDEAMASPVVVLSLEQLDDGTKYVKLDTDQEIFDNADIDEYPSIVEKYITKRFRGRVIGNANRAYVDRRAAKEYARPANHRISDEMYEAKARTATELDILLDAAEFVENKDDDKRHKEAVGGWDYYKSIVYVPRINKFYEGIISIEKVAKGDRFHDFSKLKDVTRAMQGHNASLAPDDASENNIPENGRNGKSFSVEQLDREYQEAVESGNLERATEMLMDRLAETEGIIPFNAPHGYSGQHRDIAKLIKEGTPEAVARAAADMAQFVPENGVLIPMPPHEGTVETDTDTMILANAISKLTGRPMVVALASDPRESRYQAKSEGRKGVTAEEMGFRQVKEIPEGTMPIFVDNVVGSGVTADAARTAMGGGITLAYAKGTQSKGIEGLKRATVTYDKDGKLIPLSQRFDRSIRNVNYSMEQLDQEYETARKAGDEDTMRRLVMEAARRAGYTDRVYHGTESFGFTRFDLDNSQDSVFVSYDTPNVASTYTKGDVRRINTAERPTDYASMDNAEIAEVLQKYRGDSWVFGDYDSVEGTEDGGFRFTFTNDRNGKAYSTVETRESVIDALRMHESNDSTQGIYEMFADPGNQLVIDLDGHRWDRIPWDVVVETLDYDAAAMFAHPEGSDVNTRQLAEFARYEGFDSVRINAIYDNGGRSGKGGINEGYGDVGIFFNSNAVKSADLVTYDDQGNVIPLSQRFNPENPDIRYSMEQAPDMDVQAWMAGLTPGSLQTEDERALLQAWKDKRMSISLSIKRQLDYRAKIKRLENSADSLTPQEREDLVALRNKLQVQEEKQARLEKEMYQITSQEGFAGMMYQQNMVMRDFITGRTQDEINDTVDDMVHEVQRMAGEIAEARKNLEKLAETEDLKQAQKALKGTQLNQNAKSLKKEYRSKMTENEIQARLAEMALKLAAGGSMEDVAESARELAYDLGRLQNGYMGGAYGDLADRLKQVTIVIGKEQRDQLNAQHSSIPNLRRQLAGSGVRVVYDPELRGAGTLEDIGPGTEIHDLIPELGEDTGNMMNNLDVFVGLVQSTLKNLESEMLHDFDLDDAAMMIQGYALLASTELQGDPAMTTQVKRLLGLAKGEGGTAGELAERLKNAQDYLKGAIDKGEQAKGLTKMLRKDVDSAINYYNKTAAVAAKVEKQKVKEGLIAQLKSEHAKALYAEQEKWKELIKKDKKARETAQDNLHLRSIINTDISRIRKLIMNETDQKNIPEEAKPLARQLLKMLGTHDFVGYRKVLLMQRKDIAAMMDALNAYEKRDGGFDAEKDLRWLIIAPETEYADYDAYDQVCQDLIDIESGLVEYRSAEGQGLISLMDRNAALKKVQTAVTEIYDVIRAKQEVEINGRRMLYNELAQQARDDMKDSRYKGEWVGATKPIGAVKGAILYGNMTPEYFFKNLKNKTISMLWGMYHKAENQSGLEIKKAKLRMAEIAEETGFESWDQEKKYSFQLARGGKVELTLGEMMSLYATWQREMMNQAEVNGPEKSFHLELGGFYVEEKTDKKAGREIRKQRAHKVTEDDMNAIKDAMTPEQLSYVNQVVGYLSNEMAELGNEASMRMFGIKKFNEEWYFPFEMWSGEKSVKSDAGVAGTQQNRVASGSASRRRVNNARNALVIRDFTDVAVKHINWMITYNTFAPAIETMQRVMNTKLNTGEGDDVTMQNVRTAFGEAYGSDALKYYDDFQKHINGGAARVDKTPWDLLLRTFRKISVAGSLSVTLQQPLSYIRAANLINGKYLVAAMNPATWRGSKTEMEKYSGVAVIKSMGKFDMNYGESAVDYMSPQKKTGTARKVWDWIADKSTKAPEVADTVTWTRLWTACKMEQAALNPEMDKKSDEFLEKVAERFNEVMRQTQVYDSVLVKSKNMRSNNPVIRSMTSFMGEPTLSINVIADAFVNAKGSARGKLHLANAAGLFLLSAVAQAAIKALMGAARTPDEKKNKEENFLYRFEMNLLNEANIFSNIPGYSDLISLLKGEEINDDAYSVLTKLFKAAETMEKWVSGEAGAPYRYLEDSAGVILQIFSRVPLKNIMRDARAMYNWFIDKPYANRETSAGVLRYQHKDLFYNADNMLGVINTKRGKEGYQTTNDAYYARLWNATKAGDDKAAAELEEYLTLGRGVKKDAITAGLRTAIKKDNGASIDERLKALKESGMQNYKISEWVAGEYKEGRLTKEEATKAYLLANPKEDKNDAYFAMERQDYEKETGIEVGTSDFFRLDAAIEKGNEKEITAAEKELLNHGFNKDQIESHKKSYFAKAYKSGDISRKEAEQGMKKYSNGLTDDDIYWALEEVDYEAKTHDDVSGAYYKLNAAIEKNDSAAVSAAEKELLSHGYEKEDIKKHYKSYFTDKYREGKISRSDAEAGLKKYRPDLDAGEVFWTFDRIDFKKETGKDSGGGYYYRLTYAIDTNKADQIKSAVNLMLKHGVKAKNIKSNLPDKVKDKYLSADMQGKTRIRNALQIAFKALGYTAADADKAISNWTKPKKKK